MSALKNKKNSIWVHYAISDESCQLMPNLIQFLQMFHELRQLIGRSNGNPFLGFINPEYQ